MDKELSNKVLATERIFYKRIITILKDFIDDYQESVEEVPWLSDFEWEGDLWVPPSSLIEDHSPSFSTDLLSNFDIQYYGSNIIEGSLIVDSTNGVAIYLHQPSGRDRNGIRLTCHIRYPEEANAQFMFSLFCQYIFGWSIKDLTSNLALNLLLKDDEHLQIMPGPFPSKDGTNVHQSIMFNIWMSSIGDIVYSLGKRLKKSVNLKTVIPNQDDDSDDNQ